MSQIAGLTGKGGGDQFGGLGEILSLLLQFKDTGGKSIERNAAQPTADPSASPIGEATATAGVVSKTAPIPPGAPKDDGSFLGNNRFSLSNEESPGLNTDNFSLQTAAPSSKGPTTGNQGGGIPGVGTGSMTQAGATIGTMIAPGIGTAIGGGIGAVADIGMAIAGIAGGGDTTWEDRLNEQAFKIRETFKVAYEDYFLPLQIEAKQYANAQMGKNTDQYEYASTALKGYIEGYAGVMGGQKEWDEVWTDIGGDLEALEPAPNETWMDFYEDNYNNAQPNVYAQEMVFGIMNEVLGDTWLSQLGLSQGFWKNVAGEIAKMGGAMIGASRDMRNMNQEGMYRGSI